MRGDQGESANKRQTKRERDRTSERKRQKANKTTNERAMKKKRNEGRGSPMIAVIYSQVFALASEGGGFLSSESSVQRMEMGPQQTTHTTHAHITAAALMQSTMSIGYISYASTAADSPHPPQRGSLCFFSVELSRSTHPPLLLSESSSLLPLGCAPCSPFPVPRGRREHLGLHTDTRQMRGQMRRGVDPASA